MSVLYSGVGDFTKLSNEKSLSGLKDELSSARLVSIVTFGKFLTGWADFMSNQAVFPLLVTVTKVMNKSLSHMSTPDMLLQISPLTN